MTDHLTRPDGERLALKQVEGEGPIVLWVGGFRSDMEGTKALALEAAARERGWAFVRYDHFAHGQSTGEWRKATVGRWCEDACALVDHLVGTGGRQVVPVGSSMGGWVALNLTLARPQAVKGLVLINPAQDFTERLMWPDLGPDRQAEILETGETLPLPSAGFTHTPGEAVTLGIRPNHLQASEGGPIAMQVRTVEQLGGDSYLYGALANGNAMTLHVNGQTGMQAGDTIGVKPDGEHVHLFDTDTGLSLRAEQ